MNLKKTREQHAGLGQCVSEFCEFEFLFSHESLMPQFLIL